MWETLSSSAASSSSRKRKAKGHAACRVSSLHGEQTAFFESYPSFPCISPTPSPDRVEMSRDEHQGAGLGSRMEKPAGLSKGGSPDARPIPTGEMRTDRTGLRWKCSKESDRPANPSTREAGTRDASNRSVCQSICLRTTAPVSNESIRIGYHGCVGTCWSSTRVSIVD